MSILPSQHISNGEIDVRGDEGVRKALQKRASSQRLDLGPVNTRSQQSLKLSLPRVSVIWGVFPLLAGAVQPLSAFLGARMGKATGGLMWPIALNYSFSLLLVVIWAFSSAKVPPWKESFLSMGSFITLQWWHVLVLTAGLFGTARHWFALQAISTLGPDAATGSTLAGQVVFSTLIGYYGLFWTSQLPMTLSIFIGSCLATTGAALFAAPRSIYIAQHSGCLKFINFVCYAILSSFTKSVQVCLSRKLGQVMIYQRRGITLNYLCGMLVSLSIAFATLPQPAFNALNGEDWICLLAPPANVFALVVWVLCPAVMPLSSLTSCHVAGQMFGAILIEYAETGSHQAEEDIFVPSTVMGILLTLIGVVVLGRAAPVLKFPRSDTTPTDNKNHQSANTILNDTELDLPV